MSKALIAYFSASGETAKLSKTFASAIDANLHEIVPEKPYTSADLDWRDKRRTGAVLQGCKSGRRKGVPGKCRSLRIKAMV